MGDKNMNDPEKVLSDTIKELEASREILLLLQDTSKAITSEMELAKLVQKITDKATQLSGARFGAFFFNVVVEGKEFQLYTISGVDKKHFSKFPNPRATKIFHPTFHGERTVRFDDVTQEQAYGQNAPYYGMPAGHLPVKSYLAVPVKSPLNGEVIGGLFLGHPEPAMFTAREQKLVEGIALQGAIAMGNARLFEKQKKIEAELHDQSEAYKSILNATFDAVLILSMDGRIVQHNQEAGQVFSFLGSDIDGLKIGDLLSHLHPQLFDSETLKSRTITFRSTASKAGDQETKLDCRARIFTFRNEEHILLMLRDITDFLRAEADLKQSRSFSTIIAETSPVVLFLTDDQARLTYVNPLWLKWTGAPMERHADSGWMDFILQEDRELFRNVFHESFSTRKSLDVDIRLQLPAGTRWVNLHAESFYHEDLRFAGLAGSMMDITAKKTAEATLYKKNQETQEDLARQVKERTAELEKMNYELLQFSSIASHDLKEPVRKISTFAKMLSEHLKDKLSPSDSKYLGNIVRSSARMTRLINDLLEFSRLSHAEHPQFLETDLNGLVRGVIDDLELSIRQKQAQINVGNMPVIRCIPFQMSQVFQNLISNSLKFSDPDRELRISITSKPAKDHFIRIDYTDTGIGFEDVFNEKYLRCSSACTARMNTRERGLVCPSSKRSSCCTKAMCR